MKKKCILIILLSLYTNSYLFAQSYVCNLKGNRVELSCDSTKKIMVISGSMDSSDISRILMETNSAIGEKNIEILEKEGFVYTKNDFIRSKKAAKNGKSTFLK